MTLFLDRREYEDYIEVKAATYNSYKMALENKRK